MLLRLVISVEKKEVALTKMLSTALKNKEKIEETIEELDQYKRDALQKTWEKVNHQRNRSIVLCSATNWEGASIFLSFETLYNALVKML
jgi:hypothetical protein